MNTVTEKAIQFATTSVLESVYMRAISPVAGRPKEADREHYQSFLRAMIPLPRMVLLQIINDCLLRNLEEFPSIKRERILGEATLESTHSAWDNEKIRTWVATQKIKEQAADEG